MTADFGDLTFVIMTRTPSPGRVKSRLIVDGFFDAGAAASCAEFMLACTVDRLAARARTVLAATTHESIPVDTDPVLRRIARRAAGPNLLIVDQGAGDLGERIDRVWRGLGDARPVAFFGIDTPDVPDTHLGAIVSALEEAEIAVGRTDDGGYWTLAARAYHPEVLRGIDWGGDSVYDQTCRRAAENGLAWHALPAWQDVDHPADVRALRRRLAEPRTPGSSLTDSDQALERLAERLDTLLLGRLEGRRADEQSDTRMA